MRLVIRVLGLDLLDIDMTTDVATDDEPGETTAYPIGFAAPPLVPLDLDMPDRE